MPDILLARHGVEAQHRVHAFHAPVARIEVDVGKAVAALSRHQAVVRPRELDVAPVEHFLLDPAGVAGGIDGPAAQALPGAGMRRAHPGFVREQRGTVGGGDIRDDLAIFLDQQGRNGQRGPYDPRHRIGLTISLHAATFSCAAKAVRRALAAWRRQGMQGWRPPRRVVLPAPRRARRGILRGLRPPCLPRRRRLLG